MNTYKDKLSIFLYAHNRQYYLNRVCDYYKELIDLYGIRIYISDSSKNSWCDAEKYPEFTYKHYGPELNYEKFLITLEEVETEYVILAPDDDFYIKTSIIECLEFLIANPEYSVAHGEFLRFDSFSAKLVDSSYAKNHYTNFIEHDYNFKSAKDRLLNYFDVRNFLMINHSVVKTKPMVDSMKIRLSNEGSCLKPYKFSDAQFALMQLLEGNIKVLPCVYGLRDIDRMLARGDVPAVMSPEFTFDDFPEIMLENHDPYSPIIAKKENISIDKASFIFALVIQKLITGRWYSKYITLDKFDHVFPSQTGKYSNDIKEILILVKKYRNSIPHYSKPSIFLLAKSVLKIKLGKFKSFISKVYNCLLN